VAKGRVVQTTGYNGGVPGPLIRLKQGVPVTMDLINETRQPEFIHFRGLATSIIVDGAVQKTHGDRRSPSTRLVSKRAASVVAPGQTVTLTVRNGDGLESQPFSFTRP